MDMFKHVYFYNFIYVVFDQLNYFYSLYFSRGGDPEEDEGGGVEAEGDRGPVQHKPGPGPTKPNLRERNRKPGPGAH